MQEWHNHIGDMLAYVNDVLTAHGFDGSTISLRTNFASPRQMLSRRIDA
jgi:hypothetical protein